MLIALDGRLCKAGRALVGWNQADLAAAANVAKQTVADFERGARQPFPNNRRAIAEALAQAGVAFVEESGNVVGVRWRDPAEAPSAGEMVARALGRP